MLAVFRVDASSVMGIGHVMRCLALAEALADAGWRCAFAGVEETKHTVPASTFAEYSWRTVSGDPDREPAELHLAWPGGADLLVVDHYGRDGRFESACRPWARRILAVDDLCNRPHDCDVLLDQTPDLEDGAYGKWLPPGAMSLLGPRHALLRQEFSVRRPMALARRNLNMPPRRALVSFGGSDQRGLVAAAIEGLGRAGVIARADVVVDQATIETSDLEKLAATAPLDIRLLGNVSNMATLMEKADVALGAAGVTSWERCCLGLPTLMVVVADNQRLNARALTKSGAVISLCPSADATADAFAASLRRLAEDSKLMNRMSSASANMCDGLGTSRVLAALVANRRPARLTQN